MLHNLQAAVSDVPAMGGHPGFNLILIPGFNANVGIVRLDAQLGLAGQVVSLRPIVGSSESGKGEDSKQRQEDFANHGALRELDTRPTIYSDVSTRVSLGKFQKKVGWSGITGESHRSAEIRAGRFRRG